MRVFAILATYNEERFLGACLDNLIRQGCEVHLLDNESTDATVAIAERYLGHGVIGIETIPRAGKYSWKPILERKEEVAARADADWFLHVDADEIRLPPPGHSTLAETLAAVDAEGYNAVNFFEFTFIPTRESPDHDHSEFQKTMRWYYPFLPSFPNQLKAWKRQSARVDVASSGGHQVSFPGLRIYPVSFPMRHYFILSREHAFRKFVARRYDPEEVERGWHRWRSRIRPERIEFPPASELRTYVSDDLLDPTNPRTRHWGEEWVGPA